MTASPRKLRGPQVRCRGARTYGNLSYITARWPGDGLQALRILSLTFVASGRADFRCGRYTLHCDAGTLILQMPGTPGSDGTRPHLEGERLAGGHCETLGISPRGRGVQLWLKHSRGREYSTPPAGGNAFVPNAEAAQLFQLLGDEVTAGRAGWEEICEHQLSVLFLLLQRELQDRRYLSLYGDTHAGPLPAGGYDPIVQAQNYIRAHLHDALTTTGVAQRVHLSRAQFVRLFRARTGQSFLEWTSAQRLQAAQDFLRDTGWAIPHIGGFVGFKSVSYFHQWFRRQTQTTPQQFRRRHRRAKNLS